MWPRPKLWQWSVYSAVGKPDIFDTSKCCQFMQHTLRARPASASINDDGRVLRFCLGLLLSFCLGCPVRRLALVPPLNTSKTTTQHFYGCDYHTEYSVPSREEQVSGSRPRILYPSHLRIVYSLLLFKSPQNPSYITLPKQFPHTTQWYPWTKCVDKSVASIASLIFTFSI